MQQPDTTYVTHPTDGDTMRDPFRYDTVILCDPKELVLVALHPPITIHGGKLSG
jgi:hypothetical protein